MSIYLFKYVYIPIQLCRYIFSIMSIYLFNYVYISIQLCLSIYLFHYVYCLYLFNSDYIYHSIWLHLELLKLLFKLYLHFLLSPLFPKCGDNFEHDYWLSSIRYRMSSTIFNSILKKKNLTVLLQLLIKETLSDLTLSR